MRTLLFSACLFIATGVPAADNYPQGRLPDAAKPVAYRLDLTVVPERERFSGHVEIDVTLKAATKSLYLHGRELHVTSATATSGGKRVVATYTELDKLGVARLDFAQSLPAGNATLSFDYDAPFGNGPAGLYRIKVGDDWYSWTQFESIDARAAFPSFDEPAHKTPFTVSLTTRPGFMAVSNAPERGSAVKVGDLVKHTFEPTKPLPTYLVAFVVGPFISVEGVAPATALRKHPLPLRIIATKSQAGKLDYALAETPRIVELLEDYFDHPFPYPKLDQIASPVMPGAMENAGADIYADNIILLDKGASTHQKQIFGMVVAHELSHQWFGDYVTPAWWDDIWLNESFANWMGYRIGNEWRPELNIGVNAIEEALVAMNTDALEVGRPIHQPILVNGEIDSAFDGITYGKGGQVIAMIARYLGDEKFRDGVRLHMQRHPYGSATSDEFFTALADAARDPRVLLSMQSFVSEQGVPVVNLAQDGTGYTATQSRYTKFGDGKSNQKWIIPFCVRRGETSSCTLIDQKTQAIATKGQGTLVPNAGGTGYYRYNLSTRDWDALIARGASLPAGEGVAASDSLWAQFSTGNVSAAQLIRAAEVFADNPDSNVAIHGGDRLWGWNDRGLVTTSAQADYRRVMSSIYGRKLTSIGFNPAVGAHKGDTPDVQKLRQELVYIVSDQARDPATRKTLSVAAAACLKGDAKVLDQAFYDSALRVMTEDGDIATTKDFYERMLATHDELFRDALLDAIAASGRQEDARWFISKLQDERLRSTDRLLLMKGLMKENSTRDVAFDWLKNNYDSFAKGAGLFAASSIPSLPAAYCSAEKAGEVDQLLRAKVIEAGRGELPFNRMIESIRACGRLKDMKTAEIGVALKQAAVH
ncbi:MAG TPA: M1 family metallopeptidase [Steroidobacter sp.]